MGRSLRLMAVAMAAALLTLVGATAAERVALVIGNSAYRNVSPLPNPAKDARDIAAAFERLGFEVEYREDLTFDAMRTVLLDFGDRAAAADQVAVYYAGHGMEIDKQNYLIPIDAKLATDRSVAFEAVPLDLVLTAVEGARRLKIVIVDACRNNPFSAGMKRTGATRAIGRGLSRVEPSTGTLVAYSAKEGTVADDGDDGNSPYATALLHHLEEPGLEINLMFRKVRDDVLADTSNRQEPFTYGSLPGESIYLVPPNTTGNAPEGSTPATPVQPPLREAEPDDRLAWNAIKDTTSVAMLKSFVDHYPRSLYADFARARIDELSAGGTEVARSEPPAALDEDRTRTVTDFVERRYLKGDIHDVDTLRSNYGDYVDYYDKGQVTQSEVVADKLAYGRKWLDIFYDIVPGTLRIENLGEDKYRASFTYDFHVASTKRSVSGRAASRLVLDLSQGDPRIVGEAGEVISRR